MNVIKKISIIIIVQAICLVSGCSGMGRADSTMELGATIGLVAEVIAPETVDVEGFGIVAGLQGTGSSDCNPQIREYLTQYIMSQLSEELIGQTENIINSLNTAVVHVEGQMPLSPERNSYFDLRVSALQGTQTTSLNNGWLYRTELKIDGSFGLDMETLADAEGPIFMDKIDSVVIEGRRGYVLAGGRTLFENKIRLQLSQNDFLLTNAIRNRLNTRFGRDVASAIIPGQVEVTIPARYKNRKERFISIIKAMYLDEPAETLLKRIDFHIQQMLENPENGESEFALEGIGSQSLASLAGLLSAPNEQVRLRAARCMLSLGSETGLSVLSQIAMNTNSAFRIEAINAIAYIANPDVGRPILRKYLNDNDINIRLVAYEHLRNLADPVITREVVAKSFFIEQIAQGDTRLIYVSRSGQPRIVLFGGPMRCRSGVFVQSADGNVTIDSPAGQGYVTLIRKNPRRAGTVVTMRSSFELSDIIRTLCDDPAGEDDDGPGGLGVFYADVIALLKQMCDKNAVDAEFYAGSTPKID